MSVQLSVIKLDIAVQKYYLCKRERHEAAGNRKGRAVTAGNRTDTDGHRAT
ncbi:hypothetical protein [Prevotella sp.]|uniref:hypothetical protein n=1 Tax=uncultured Prevotella sp. TaxID=159272 RepID=UPI0025E6EB09|nr:hypothetical protein [uncultured Prevotella sp.]